jgi:hypothetical protein
MKNSIFLITKKNIYVIVVVSLVMSLLFFYSNMDSNNQVEFFIPEKPSMNEYYIHSVKKCPDMVNPNVRYFMAIPYGDNIVSKNNLWNLVRDCSEDKKYLPKTYLLDNFQDNIQFSKDFSDKKLYILKKNIQRKQGLKLYRGPKSLAFREYEKGGYKLIQEFIANPYLLNKRIMVVRLYLVAYSNPEYTYGVHKYGKCLYTNKDFNLEDLDNLRLITDSKIKLDGKFPKNLEELNKVDSKVNLDLLIKPVKTVIKCFKKYLEKIDDTFEHKHLTFFQLFGVDIMLDSAYNPYLLEINKSPDMNNIYDEADREGKMEVISDTKNFISGENKNFRMI